MKSFQIIDDHLATIGFLITKILWHKPMIVGATILDLAKNETYSKLGISLVRHR